VFELIPLQTKGLAYGGNYLNQFSKLSWFHSLLVQYQYYYITHLNNKKEKGS